ncbi:GNAT family N-acetyltransferase [Actinospica robiniae]|uniref:GNAT family N-acetyltransferase n=1 Tax=Actinospica robiniae TaxID=304901 RepID=UPI00041BAC5A|nr:GNAT family N-acetyltransferase [Actinospica robiniae]
MDSSSPLRADDPGLADAVARNLAEAVAHLNRHTPGAGARVEADLVFADSGVADPTFNAVAYVRLDPGTAGARIEQVLARMAQTGRPFVWWVDPGTTPADLGARLLAAGLAQVDAMPVMVLPLEKAPVAWTAADHAGAEPEIREVLTATQWADFCEVLLSCWDAGRSPMREFLARARLSALAPDGRGRFLVGYVDSVPVCTADVLLHAGVAGIYNVVTRPEHQRRGYGTAITVAALELARDAGYRTASLQASSQGRPVYQRLGFEQVGQYAIYQIGG